MRNFNPALLALLDEGRTDIVGMIRFDLGEGIFGFIHRSSPHTFEGVEYQPLPAGILSVSDFPMATGTAAEGFTIELSESPDDGLTPDVIVQLESYDYRDRPVTVFDWHHHPDTGLPLTDPIAQMRGYINAVEHTTDPDRGYIVRIECESRAIDYSRTNGRIRSVDDQRRRLAGDRGFEHAAVTGRQKIKWGRE